MTTSQPVRKGGHYTSLAAAIIIAAVLISASILYATSTPTTVTKTVPEITTTTQTTTLTVISTNFATPTTSVNTNTSIEAALLSICSQARSPGSGVWKLVAGTNLAAVICFQLYYYDSTTPLTLNASQALSIQALQYTANGSVNYPRSFSGASNFTVTASQNQLVIGGPNNENEGSVLAYGITAKSGANGAYQLSFIPSVGLSNWMLSSQEPLQCGYYGQLVAGTGQPNYVQPTGCITYRTTTQSSTSATTSSSNYHTAPGISYPLLNGDIYFQITGVANSTQIGGIG